ncbi:glycosyltransferase family 4 protein [Gluconacetobacter sacchari]|uniref:Glycosyltransferase family 4 protein n=2 Tax=Gluconacetobacter sacchari TaxID=92759 RepID=A0A7W4NPK8_9PROT|nr:glycosyltransferase family 4 protein [Gluconacetobacter sacchari]MBB2161667.1 glycosyltransferase family 4 protein [Gluconacetobacter sacchari]GBQ19215.1 glycosyltransferase [Gluconacetobacter sacchari DSM 12717]
MKLLFISNLFPPNQIGGYEVLCARVAGAMAQRGHEVRVLTSCYGGRISDHEGMRVAQGLRLLCGDTIYQSFAKGELRRQVISDDNAIVTRELVERLRPDVVFAWNLYGLHKDYFHMIERLGVPAVCMLTDNWLAEMMAPAFIGTYFERHIYGDRPGGGLVPAETIHKMEVAAIFGARSMQALHEAAGLGFRDATVIHNGVDLTDVLARTRKPRRELGEGPVRLLFAGRLVRLKGVHTAIEALGELDRRSGADRRSFSLTIVGDDTDAVYLAHLMSLVARLGLAEKVTFLPPVAEADLGDLFDRHDLYLFPSLYEPFSLTLIHAMATGIPTIASAVGGNVEIVEDRRTGLIFAPGNATDLAAMIAFLAEDGELRERISQAARDAAAQFTTTRMVEQMEAYLARQIMR